MVVVEAQFTECRHYVFIFFLQIRDAVGHGGKVVLAVAAIGVWFQGVVGMHAHGDTALLWSWSSDIGVELYVWERHACEHDFLDIRI